MKLFLLTAFIFSSFLIWGPAHGATVTSYSKSKKLVKIDLEGESIKRGAVVVILSDDGKKVGVAKIAKVKRGIALAKLKKGRAKKGYQVSVAGKESKKAGKSKGSKHFIFGDDVFFGFMGGMASNNMTVKNTATQLKQDIAGSGTTFKFFYDYPLLNMIWLRAGAGMHDFSAEGDSTTSCTSNSVTTTCVAGIQYLSLDLTGRVMFMHEKSFRPWAGIILGLYIPMSEGSTTAVQPDSVTNTSTYGAVLGFDWVITKHWMVPFQAALQYFPSSEDVDANTTTLHLGIAYSF